METPLIELSAVQVLAVACFGVLLGTFIKHRAPIFDRLNIPAPIVGGLVFAVAILLMRDRVLNVKLDNSLQDILMVAFFTTVGMGASLSLLKRGGVQVAIFFGIASAGALLQDLLGIGLAKLLGVSPLLGIVAGSVALTGGPATALAFGKTFEEMGVAGASAIGVAAAMFGISAGGLLGGFLGGRLIEGRKLERGRGTSPNPVTAEAEAVAYQGQPASMEAPVPMHDESEAEENALLRTVLAVGVAMGLGTLVSKGIAQAGITVPMYIGAMIVAAVIRNLDERFGWLKIQQHRMDAVGNVALQIFIVMALMTLKLWTLIDLAGPFLVMLLCQIILVALMVVGVFVLMGRDYEAAVMAGGFTGFMLGTTANAMACMDVLVKKYGPAPRAFIVVPIVGAFLIDPVNALFITTLANIFK
ncbi:MAG: sodium/glutamate symporter [Myxococcota bacterium]|nr:sodium/glutamate symporter [Myxococcota bacterium]